MDASFPGNSAEGKKTASRVGDNSKDHTWPAGSFPDDLSPCGAADMAGNAYEWTASWYDAYPGSDFVEIEYGRKYRVIRGGGAIEYYGAPSTGRCAERGRSLPGRNLRRPGIPLCGRPTEPEVAMSSAKSFGVLLFLLTVLPVFAAPLQVPLVVTGGSGGPRGGAHVTSGVPLPLAAVPTNSTFRLRDQAGQELPLQSRILATWPDGSAKWVLLDFPFELGPGEKRELVLESSNASGTRDTKPQGLPAGAGGPNLVTTNSSGDLEANTGPLSLSFSRSGIGFLRTIKVRQGQQYSTAAQDALAPSLRLRPDTAGTNLLVLPPDEVVIEENGPLRAVVKAGGWVVAGGTNRLVKYLTRVSAFAGSSRLHVQHTITQLSEKKMLHLEDHSLALRVSARGAARYLFGGARGAHSGAITSDQDLAAGSPSRDAPGANSLRQFSEAAYEFTRNGQKAGNGFKAPGWVCYQRTNGSVLLSVKHFWQQYPKALEIDGDLVTAGLYPAQSLGSFELDQGLAKTHELLLLFEGK